MSNSCSGSEVLRDIPVQVRRDRIRGQMGYPPNAIIPQRIGDRIEAEIDRALPHTRASAVYRIYRVEALTSRSIALENAVTFQGAIRTYLGQIDRLAVFVATAGADIYRHAQAELKEGRPLEGLVANAVGSEVAECAVEELERRLRKTAEAAGAAITLPYSPGYCGMEMREQVNIFRSVDAAAIGVELLPSFLMNPIKSISGIFGLGPAEGLVATGSPCDRCDREDCMMRRYTHGAAPAGTP